MLRTLIATTALAAGLLLSSTAQAQVAPQGAVCGERGKFLTHLGKNHKESPRRHGRDRLRSGDRGIDLVRRLLDYHHDPSEWSDLHGCRRSGLGRCPAGCNGAHHLRFR